MSQEKRSLLKQVFALKFDESRFVGPQGSQKLKRFWANTRVKVVDTEKFILVEALKEDGSSTGEIFGVVEDIIKDVDPTQLPMYWPEENVMMAAAA